MKEKIKKFFSYFTWANIKTWPKWLWIYFCKLLKWRLGAAVFVLLFGVHLGLTDSKLFGLIVGLIGIWYIIQELKEK